MGNNDHENYEKLVGNAYGSKVVTCFPKINRRENVNNRPDFYHQFITLSKCCAYKCI